MKFTRSTDGVERATVLVPMRLSHVEIKMLKYHAKLRQTNWRFLLRSELACRMFPIFESLEEEAEGSAE
jgi:hypothetical protein